MSMSFEKNLFLLFLLFFLQIFSITQEIKLNDIDKKGK